jgi:hypothetical protein
MTGDAGPKWTRTARKPGFPLNIGNTLQHIAVQRPRPVPLLVCLAELAELHAGSVGDGDGSKTPHTAMTCATHAGGVTRSRPSGIAVGVPQPVRPTAPLLRCRPRPNSGSDCQPGSCRHLDTPISASRCDSSSDAQVLGFMVSLTAPGHGG